MKQKKYLLPSQTNYLYKGETLKKKKQEKKKKLAIIADGCIDCVDLSMLWTSEGLCGPFNAQDVRRSVWTFPCSGGLCGHLHAQDVRRTVWTFCCSGCQEVCVDLSMLRMSGGLCGPFHAQDVRRTVLTFPCSGCHEDCVDLSMLRMSEGLCGPFAVQDVRMEFDFSSQMVVRDFFWNLL